MNELMDGCEQHMKSLGEACVEWVKFSQVDGSEQS